MKNQLAVVRKILFEGAQLHHGGNGFVVIGGTDHGRGLDGLHPTS